MGVNRKSRRLVSRTGGFWCTIAVLLGPLLALATCGNETSSPAPPMSGQNSLRVVLPPPRTDGSRSLERSLLARRSIRAFAADTLQLAEIGQLLWAAQGITGPLGYRTAPSAGALYPLEIYAVTSAGVSRYDPATHVLVTIQPGDVREDLRGAAHDQAWVQDATLVIVVTAVYSRTTAKYGQSRGPRYVHLEAGHAAQNVLLQAVALELAGVPVGAFDDRGVQSVLGLPADHEPLYLLCVGRPR